MMKQMIAAKELKMKKKRVMVAFRRNVNGLSPNLRNKSRQVRSPGHTAFHLGMY